MSTSSVSNTTGGARRRTVKRRPTTRRPSNKTAHKGQRKLKSKTKAKRKSRVRTTSMSSKYSGGARRKSATRRSSSGRKRTYTVHSSSGHSGVKELAFMGTDRLRLGLVPPLPLQLALDPELKRKVAMSDPRVTDILGRYGPGWSGYQIGLQSGRKKPTLRWERKIEGFPAAAMSPGLHPLHPHNAFGPIGLGAVPAAVLGSDGQRRDLDALAVESALGTSVKAMDMDRLPGENFNIKSSDILFGIGAPNALRVAGLKPASGRMPRTDKPTPSSASSATSSAAATPRGSSMTQAEVANWMRRDSEAASSLRNVGDDAFANNNNE